MDTTCYRSMPKIVGTFIDALYQNSTLLLAAAAALSALAGVWWYKTHNKPE